MSSIPKELKYTREHEWIRLDGDVATVGITDYAQGELGDIVFVELPEIGDSLDKDDSFGTIEAVKAVSDLFAPLSGEVVEINAELTDTPSVINDDPYGEGWMIKIRLSDVSETEELMDPEGYGKLI